MEDYTGSINDWTQAGTFQGAYPGTNGLYNIVDCRAGVASGDRLPNILKMLPDYLDQQLMRISLLKLPYSLL
jgi:hypothetical protein